MIVSQTNNIPQEYRIPSPATQIPAFPIPSLSRHGKSAQIKTPSHQDEAQGNSRFLLLEGDLHDRVVGVQHA